MTDHLATARRWLSTAQDSRSFDHLMSAMDQILAHLDAQQAEESLRRGLADIAADRVVDLGTFAPSAQGVTSAPQTASQAEAGQGDGGEAVGERAAVQAAMAVLRDEGADSEGGWHSWRCFDRERYPEPCDCTERVARAAIAAAEPHVRAEVRAQALREAADELDLPGSTATGYYASEQDSGYRDAERDAKQWLRDRANRIEQGGRP